MSTHIPSTQRLSKQRLSKQRLSKQVLSTQIPPALPRLLSHHRLMPGLMSLLLALLPALLLSSPVHAISLLDSDADLNAPAETSTGAPPPPTSPDTAETTMTAANVDPAANPLLGETWNRRSLVLIAPFVLHIWKNWRAFKTYFKRPAMTIALVASLVAGIAFAWPSLTGTSEGRGGRPEFALLRAVQTAPISAVAPLFGQDGNGLAENLRARGYTVASTDDTLNGIAEASGKSAGDIAGVLAASGRSGESQ